MITGNSSTATQAIAVVVFVVIESCLVIIPIAYLEFRICGRARSPPIPGTNGTTASPLRLSTVVLEWQ
jgi:hypothetical protein